MRQQPEFLDSRIRCKQVKFHSALRLVQGLSERGVDAQWAGFEPTGFEGPDASWV